MPLLHCDWSSLVRIPKYPNRWTNKPCWPHTSFPGSLSLVSPFRILSFIHYISWNEIKSFHSFIHSFIHSFARSFVRSFTNTLFCDSFVCFSTSRFCSSWIFSNTSRTKLGVPCVSEAKIVIIYINRTTEKKITCFLKPYLSILRESQWG